MTKIVAWLALFFSLAGTSMAASHYLITSTRQIKPSVLRQLRKPVVVAGAPGQSGIPGQSGVSIQGATGSQGPRGEQGAPGAAGQNTLAVTYHSKEFHVNAGYADVFCGQGETVIGGGSYGGENEVTGSRISENAWQIQYKGFFNGTVFAVCAH